MDSVAIMQPYFFPYLGYFSLIANTDYFVFFDTPQYIRRGWINRNRIISGNGKDIYINVPIKKENRSTAIKDIKICKDVDWQQTLMGQLCIYKKRAPYYNSTMSIIKEVLSADSEYISELAIRSIVVTCSYLGISLKYDIFSKMSMNISAEAPDEWALNITKQLGYSTYINPPGGKEFFDRKKYDNAGIELKFLTQQLKPYIQKTKEFIPGLSIIDVMMFCSSNEIRKMLTDFTLS